MASKEQYFLFTSITVTNNNDMYKFSLFSEFILTFVRHPGSCFQVELLAPRRSDLLDVVAQGVAAVLPAVQADAPDESAVVAAPVGRALLVFIQQRVHEQMDGALMSALHCLFKACEESRTKQHTLL